MAPRLNRSAVTLEVGETLRDIAKRLAKIGEYSGDARLRELRNLSNSLPPLSQRLQQVITNCRAASGSYPNYPAVRRAIIDGGNAVYEQKISLDAIITTFVQQIDEMPDLDFSGYVGQLVTVGQNLKLIQFAPPLAPESSGQVSANG